MEREAAGYTLVDHLITPITDKHELAAIEPLRCAPPTTSPAVNLLGSSVTRKHFERLVATAVGTIPTRFRDEMDNVAVVVEDAPSPELLAEMGIVPPDTLYGLYQGVPLPGREWAHGNVLPDRIAIYQRPIVEDGDDDEAIIRAIGETVIHEFGHYFGLSEEEIEAIESRYWRGEIGSDDH